MIKGRLLLDLMAVHCDPRPSTLDLIPGSIELYSEIIVIIGHQILDLKTVDQFKNE